MGITVDSETSTTQTHDNQIKPIREIKIKMTTSYRARNTYRNPLSTHSSHNSARRAPFSEIAGAAFFLGKLNKTNNRDEIYSALMRLSKEHGFYVRKLDMPYGNKHNRTGNMGYCFVHCRSKAEADGVVAQNPVNLGAQRCEVKAYGGRDSTLTASPQSSGYSTPVDGGYRRKEEAKHSEIRSMLQSKYDTQP